MSKRIRIFVEGDGDVKFISDYIKNILPNFAIEKNTIVKTNGWTTINSEKDDTREKFKSNTDNDGTNLIIFDADKDFSKRKQEIEDWKNKYKLNFELFLFPNNSENGALEDLLENIIQEKNKPIFDCWDGFEKCVKGNETTIGKKLTIPAKKSKIYVYCETLLGETKEQKELAKDPKRNYLNKEHWNLDSDYLKPLKEFLLKTLNISGI